MPLENEGLATEDAEALKLEDLKDFKEMHSIRSLDHSEHFGEGFKPATERVYVIVGLTGSNIVPNAIENLETINVPEPIHTLMYAMFTKHNRIIEEQIVLIQKQAQIINEIRKKWAKRKYAKFAHSEMTMYKLHEMKSKVLDITDALLSPATKDVVTFEWNDPNDCEKYRKYIDDNISHDFLAILKLCVFNIESRKYLLTALITGTNTQLVGWTDVMVLSDRVLGKGSKPEFFEDSQNLIALDLRSDNFVFSLLTNLMDLWKFFWVYGKENGKAIVKYFFLDDPTDAFEAIKTLLQSPPKERVINFGQVSVKRRKLEHILGSEEDTNGNNEFMDKYLYIARILGPDKGIAYSMAQQLGRSIP
ncbi:Crinkler (CRN) family protein, partial [Thraustotheca clavata]